MKKTIIYITLVALAVLFFLVFKDGKIEVETMNGDLKTGTSIGDIAPDFTLEDLGGNKVSLSDFRDSKPVFINFWAAWCPFCVDELPLMADVQREHGDSYATLAVNRGESLNTAIKFTDGLNITDSMVFLLNEKDDIYRRYGGFAMPYSLFLDKDGVIVDIKHGPLTREDLESRINKIIQ